MESIIFKDSPLAEYLEGTGESAGSWGVDSSIFTEPTEPTQSFAPSSISLHARLRANGLKRLRLSGPGWRQRNYLYELFSKIIDSRLSSSENSRFLERFRYIIIASQLLSEHINVSHYNGRAGISLPPPTEDDSESAAFFGPRFAKARYWAGNGICIGVVTVLVGWVLKMGDDESYVGRGRAGLGFLGILITAIILFTNARRRWLRTLRGRTIELTARFVETSQNYEILASNAVTFIQEVELVSRGYRLSTPLPPVSRLERDSQTRRCTRLRRSLLSSTSLAMGPHSKAFATLRELARGNDLDKYFEIYDVRREDLEEMERGIKESELEDIQSLKVLKYLLQRMHTSRKVLLCCLLALDANGGYSDFATWRTVVEQLKALGSLMADIGEALQNESEEEQRFVSPPSPTKAPLSSPTRERWRGQLRKLNSLSQALRGLQAKMHVLREDSDRTLQESLDLVEFGPDLLAHYDSIGSDLHALVSEWESGRALLVSSIDRQGGDTTSSNRNSFIGLMSPTLDNLSGDTPRNSWGMLSPTTEDQVNKLRDEGSPAENGEEEEEKLVFEGVSEPKGYREKSNLTREERIRKVQEERVKLMEQRKNAEAGKNMVKELQTVLGSRPMSTLQQRRISAHMGRG